VALISVTISGNAAPLRNELNDSESRLSRFGGSLKKFAVIGAAAFAAAGAAAAVMGKKLISAGEAAATSNARIRQIADSMQLFGDNAENVSNRLVKLAETTAKQVGVDQNIIKSTQAKLLTFAELGKTADTAGGAFDRATKAAIDLAAAGFGEASQNAVQLGKALQDPIKGITALARSGVTFTEQEKEKIRTLVESGKTLEAQNLILEALEKQVGGTAEATANASDRIRVAFSQVAERVGQALLPAFQGFATFLIDTLFPRLEEIGNRVMPYVTEAFGMISAFIQDKVVPVVQEFLIPAFQKFARIFLDYIVPTIKTIAIPIFEGLGRIFDVIVQKVRDNRDTFSRLIQTMQVVFGFVRDKLAPVIALGLSNAFKVAAFAIGVLIDIGSKFADVFGAIVRVVAKIAGQIIDIMAGLVNTVIDAVNVMIRGFMRLPSILRFGISIDEIPKVNLSKSLTSGGGISGPSLADIRNEREGNLPAITGGTFTGGGGMAGIVEDVATGGGGGGGGGRARGGGGTTAVTVNVNGALATKAEIGDAVIQALRASNAIYGPMIASVY
jgi:phage-related protein